MLHNELYTVSDKLFTDNSLTVKVILNPGHFVYDAHFPGNPVTPGVYLLQMCKEILSEHMNKNLAMRWVKNVKFLQVLNPDKNNEVYCKICWNITGNACHTMISVENGTGVFVKINAVLTEE